MKRHLVLIAILAGSGVAIYYSQRQKSEARVGPEAVLNAVSETEREISRLPAGFARLSDEEEIRAGNALAQRYFSASVQSMTVGDAQIEHYITTVGRAVSRQAQRKLEYRFHYLPDAAFVNAFALPGGHVFVGKGLLLLMNSEDELAGVLGHEIEHVDDYHCNDRVALESRLRHLPLRELVTLPVELFQLGYSKEQELEADRDGAHLAVMAGYSPQGVIAMFQTFARLNSEYITKAQSPHQEFSQVAIQGIVGYFRSHPLPAEREAQIRRIMNSQDWPQPPLTALRFRPDPVQKAQAQ